MLPAIRPLTHGSRPGRQGPRRISETCAGSGAVDAVGEGAGEEAARGAPEVCDGRQDFLERLRPGYSTRTEIRTHRKVLLPQSFTLLPQCRSQSYRAGHDWFCRRCCGTGRGQGCRRIWRWMCGRCAVKSGEGTSKWDGNLFERASWRVCAVARAVRVQGGGQAACSGWSPGAEKGEP
jgi:hypothetical protein